MRKMIWRDGKSQLVRISKRQARKLWGKADMSLCPVNLRPGFPWRPNIDIMAVEQTTRPFDQHVSWFEWYNCSDSETGLYTAFYLIKPINPTKDDSIPHPGWRPS